MAILGFELVCSLIGATIFSKIISHASFSRYLLCKSMFRYLPPSDKYLLDLSGLMRSKDRKKSKKETTFSEEFDIPRSTEITLRKSKIEAYEIQHLPFYVDFLWLLDFSFCSCAVYLVSEVAHNIVPHINLINTNQTSKSTNSNYASIINSRFNLSLLWWFLTLLFSFKALVSASAIYFRRSSKTEKKSELSTPELVIIFSAGFIFFILGFISLAADGIYFDFRLMHAYNNLTIIDSSYHAISFGAFQTFLALFPAILGGLFIFPGIRYGRMYVDIIDDPESSILNRFITHINFISPLICGLLWCLPIINQILPIFLASISTFYVKINMHLLLVPTLNLLSWIQPNKIISLRLSVCLIFLIVRISLLKSHLQSFLKIAQQKVNVLKLEPGRISNKEIQQIVSSIFCCFNLAALQYATPAIIMAGLMCLYKNFTGPNICWFPWESSSYFSAANQSLETASSKKWDINSMTFGQDGSAWFSVLVQAREGFLSFLQNWHVKAQSISYCVFGFGLWWSFICWQIVSFVGAIYYKYTKET